MTESFTSISKKSHRGTIVVSIVQLLERDQPDEKEYVILWEL